MYSESAYLHLICKGASMIAKCLPKMFLKNQSDLHSKILVPLTSRGVYYVFISRTLCAAELLTNVRTKE